MVKIGDKIGEETIFKFIEVTFENSKQYLKDAKKILNSSPGHAYAMCVLSLEELTKSNHFLTIAMGQPPITIDRSLKRLFKNHKMKQDAEKLATELESLKDFVMETRSLEALRQIGKIIGDKKTKNIVRGRVKEELKLYDGMQRKKERGMYVDIEESKIIGPNDITKNEVKELIRHIEKKILMFEKRFPDTCNFIKSLSKENRKRISNSLFLR